MPITNLTYGSIYAVPSESPRQSIEHQFSISSLKIDYGRPAVKGRTIFGELVPFGEIWRAGANAATKFTTDQKIRFGGKIISAGEYALFAIPQPTEWKVILNRKANNWGSHNYDETQNVASISVPVEKLADTKEYFEIRFEPISDFSILLIISWENTKVEVPIEVYNKDNVLKVSEMLQEIKKLTK